MLTEQNPQNTLRYICCVFSAKSDPAALNAFDASVNLPLVSAIEKAEEVKSKLLRLIHAQFLPQIFRKSWKHHGQM